MRIRETEFDGMRFYMYKENGYYMNGIVGKLHRYVWKKNRGDIPKDMLVHHKDGDKTNNNIWNLELKHKSKHIKHHGDADKLGKFMCARCGKEFISRICSTGAKKKDEFSGNRFCSRSCANMYSLDKRYYEFIDMIDSLTTEQRDDVMKQIKRGHGVKVKPQAQLLIKYIEEHYC